jgi:hypothetical protein
MPEREETLAPVIRLHAIRTLVIGRDLAFRQRAVTVFAELGIVAFAVAPLEVPEEVVALIARERADVVVLDATGCAPAIARVVYELSECAPRVGVVLVASRTDQSPRLPTLDKWGWAEELTRAVQHAYHRGNPLKEEPVDVGRQH